ncbi:unnamed protein product [Closterium sp. NIES-53]
MSAIAVSHGNRFAPRHFDSAMVDFSSEMPPLVDAVGKASQNRPTGASSVIGGTASEAATSPPSPPRFADLYGSPQVFSESPSMSDFPQDWPASNLPRGPPKSEFPQNPPAIVSCSESARLSRGGLRRHRRVASSPQTGQSELEGSLDGNAEREGTQRIVTRKIDSIEVPSDGRSAAVRSRHNRRSSVGGASSGSTETGSSGGNGGHCGDLYGRQELVHLVPAGQITAVSAFSPKSPSIVSLSRKSSLPKSPSSQSLPRPGGGSPPRRTSYSSDAIPLQRGGCSAEMPLQLPDGVSRGSSTGANSRIDSQRSPFSVAGFRSPRDDNTTACAAEISPSPRAFRAELPPSPSPRATTPREGAARAPPRSPAVGRLAAARAWNKMMAAPPLTTEQSPSPAELLSPSPRGVSTAATTSGRTKGTFLPLYPEIEAPRRSSAELSPHGATTTTPPQRSPLSRSRHPRSPLALASPPSARAFPVSGGSAESLPRICREDGIGSSSSVSSGGSGSNRSSSSDSSIGSNIGSDNGSSGSGGGSSSRRLKREQLVSLEGNTSAEIISAAEAATTATAGAEAEREMMARAAAPAPDIPLDLLMSARRLMAECEARGVRWELLNAAGGLSGSSAEPHVAALSPNPGSEAPRAALRARATPARAIPVSRLHRGRVSSCSSLPVSADLTSALLSSPLSTSPLSPSPLSPLSAASASVLSAASAKPAPAESPSRRDRSGAQGNERAQDSLAVAAQQQQQKQKQKQQQRQLVGASKRDRVKQLRVLGKHGSFEQLSGFFSNVLSLSRGSSGDDSTNSGCSSPCPSNPGSLLEKISAEGISAKPTDFVLRMPYEDIKARYSLGKKEIGEGRFGSIRTCLERSSGNFYACKTISKKIIETHEEAQDVRREVLFLATLKGHPYIVTLKEALEDKTAIHLIMELCPGGDLFEQIKSRAQLSEPEAASIVRQLLEALIHSHSLGILHRDVKPENILLCSPTSCSSIKLIDFGVATVLPEGALCNEAAGTPEYMAPEVYDEKYGFGADVWGAGVSLYVMLSGIPPFWESTNRSLEQAIRSKKVSFKHWKWVDVSAEAKELITRMLEKDPSKRITAQEALEHPWITKLAPAAA